MHRVLAPPHCSFSGCLPWTGTTRPPRSHCSVFRSFSKWALTRVGVASVPHGLARALLASPASTPTLPDAGLLSSIALPSRRSSFFRSHHSFAQGSSARFDASPLPALVPRSPLPGVLLSPLPPRRPSASASQGPSCSGPGVDSKHGAKAARGSTAGGVCLDPRLTGEPARRRCSCSTEPCGAPWMLSDPTGPKGANTSTAACSRGTGWNAGRGCWGTGSGAGRTRCRARRRSASHSYEFASGPCAHLGHVKPAGVGIVGKEPPLVLPGRTNRVDRGKGCLRPLCSLGLLPLRPLQR